MYRVETDAMNVHDPDKHLDGIISVISSLGKGSELDDFHDNGHECTFLVSSR